MTPLECERGYLQKEDRVSHEGFSLRHRLSGYLEAAKIFWNSPEGKSYNPKARIAYLLQQGSGIYPDRLLIERVVVPFEEKDTIQSLLEEGVYKTKCFEEKNGDVVQKQRYSLAVRTAFRESASGGSGGTTPFIMGMQTFEDVRTFINETYEKEWKKNPNISHVIIMKNPIGLYTTPPEELVVFGLGFQKSYATHNLALDLTFGTPHTRVLEQRPKESKVTGIFAFTTDRILEANTGSTYLKIGKKIGKNQVSITRAVVNQIMCMIHDRSIRLAERLEILDELCGLNIIQGQSFIDPYSGVRKVMIYDVGGPGDDARMNSGKVVAHI